MNQFDHFYQISVDNVKVKKFQWFNLQIVATKNATLFFFLFPFLLSLLCYYIFFSFFPFLLSRIPLSIIPVQKFSLCRRATSLARSQHASKSQNHRSPLRYGKNKFPKPLRENPNHRFIEGERFGLHDCGGWQIKGLDCRMGVLGWWWVTAPRSQDHGRSNITFAIMVLMKHCYLHHSSFRSDLTSVDGGGSRI